MESSYSKIRDQSGDENGNNTYSAVKIAPIPTRKPTGLISVIMIILCVLVGDMARGILFPTLWLLVQSHGGGRFYQGCAVSAFSAGRIISSPIFGYGSEKFGYRYILMLCNIVIFLGCYLYAMSSSLSMVIGGQFVIGFGAGSLGVTRSFVAETTYKSERTLYMAYLTAVQYAGFTLTPVLGALVASWGSQLSTALWGYLPLTAYSLPAIALGLIALMCTVLLFVLFVEVSRDSTECGTLSEADPHVEDGANIPAYQSENTSSTDGMEMQRLADTTYPSYRDLPEERVTSTTASESDRRLCGQSLFDVLSVAGCAFNMATKGTIGVFETLGLVYVTTHYDWSSLRSGLTFSAAGVVGVIALLLFSVLLRFVSDVNLVLYGMLIMTVSCVMFSIKFSDGLPLWAFYVAIALMYSVGYPVGHTALIGIFSKLVKSGPQGRILGLFGSAGSLARILFPLLAGLLTELYGDRVIFAVMAVILAVSCAMFAYFKTVIQEYVNL